MQIFLCTPCEKSFNDNNILGPPTTGGKTDYKIVWLSLRYSNKVCNKFVTLYFALNDICCTAVELFR